MMENFTEKSRRVIKLATQKAANLGHGHLGSEHLLYGLLAENANIACQILKKYRLTEELLTKMIVAYNGQSMEKITQVELTANVKKNY